MPKNAGGRGLGGSSKLRFVMLEADLADGDLTQITQAITNALKHPGAPGPKGFVGAGTATPKAATAASAEILDEGADEELEDETDVPAPSRPSRPSGATRVYRTPERLDLDISAFAAFAKAKNPPDDLTKKHLVVAYWFKEHFNTANVGIDHAYSAYLAAGWSPKAKDFDQPFRMLKKKGLVKRIEPGIYTITLPGMVEVREMSKPGQMDASA